MTFERPRAHQARLPQDPGVALYMAYVHPPGRCPECDRLVGDLLRHMDRSQQASIERDELRKL